MRGGINIQAFAASFKSIWPSWVCGGGGGGGGGGVNSDQIELESNMKQEQEHQHICVCVCVCVSGLQAFVALGGIQELGDLES